MVSALKIKLSFHKPQICPPPYILAFRGILNLSIISSLWRSSRREGFDSDMAGSLEIPNRARIPLLHSAREIVTNVAWVDMVDLCLLIIWRENRVFRLHYCTVFYPQYIPAHFYVCVTYTSPITRKVNILVLENIPVTLQHWFRHHNVGLLRLLGSPQLVFSFAFAQIIKFNTWKS